VKFGMMIHLHMSINSVLNVVSKSTMKNMAEVSIFDVIFVTARRIQNTKVQRTRTETLCISVWMTPFQSWFFYDTNFIICTKKNLSNNKVSIHSIQPCYPE
jgi:hypothetical protein